MTLKSFVDLLLAGGLCFTVLAASGCGKSPAQAGGRPADEVTKVLVATPVEQEVQDVMDYTGRLEAVESVEIRARVSGYLTHVAFMGSLSTEVKKDEVLFQIDDRPYRNSLAAAEARVASANAMLTTSAAELARTEGLFKKGVVVQAELDRDVGRKAQADAEILSAAAGLAQAQLDLEFTTIKAPIDGILSTPHLTAGNLVSPQTQSLTTLVSVDPIYVYFDVDEPTILRIQENVRSGKLPTRDEGTYVVRLGLANDTGHPYTGKLDFLDNQLDLGTGTLRVRGRFDNPKPERGSRPLTPGLFARVQVPLGAPRPSLLISERAIGRSLGKPFVYVIDGEKKVQTRTIQLGALHGGLRVVTEGLQSGDQVVISGLQRIRRGQTVEPILKEMTEAEAP